MMHDTVAVHIAFFLRVGTFAIGSTGAGPGKHRAPRDEAGATLLTAPQASLSDLPGLFLKVPQSPGLHDAHTAFVPADANVAGIIRHCADHAPDPQAANGPPHSHITSRIAASARTTSCKDRARRVRVAEDAFAVLRQRTPRIARDAPNTATFVLALNRPASVDRIPPGAVGRQMGV